MKTAGNTGSQAHSAEVPAKTKPGENELHATRLPPRAPILILDVGCGIRKQPGAIGIDRNPASQPDVLVDLDKFPYPFPDNSFDRITAIHVIEHLSYVIRSMEEFHRQLRPGGTLRTEQPHYTVYNSFCHPTHRSHRNSLSYGYFGQN